MAVIVWFQMNANEDLKIYKKLFQLGVDGIITNVPKLLKLYRDHYYSKTKNK